jgi:hypothetical protein
VAGPPSPVFVASDLPRLYLDHQDPEVPVRDHEISLAVPQSAMVSRPSDPGDVRVEPVLGRKRGVHALEHEVFG